MPSENTKIHIYPTIKQLAFSSISQRPWLILVKLVYLDIVIFVI